MVAKDVKLLATGLSFSAQGRAQPRVLWVEEGQPQPKLQRRTEGIRLHSETKAWSGRTQKPVASMRHRASRQQILSTDTASLLERIMNGLVLLVGQLALHMGRGEQPLQI